MKKTIRVIKEIWKENRKKLENLLSWSLLVIFVGIVVVYLFYPVVKPENLQETATPQPISDNQEEQKENIEIERIEKLGGYTPVVYLNDLKWFSAKIKEDNKYAYIDIEYPQFIGGDEVKKLNKYIKEIVLNILYTDRNYVKEWIVNKEEWCDDTYEGRPWSCSVQLVSEYEVISAINDIVSLELVITDYTGGGNGNHSTAYIINWDLEKNLLLDKKDIFCSKEYPAELVDLVYENMLDKYSASIDEEYLHSRKESVDEEIQSSEFEILLGYHDLSIVFQPYAVLSGVHGIVKAPIPYSKLKNKICFSR